MSILERTVCLIKWFLIFLIGVPFSLIGIPLSLISNRSSYGLLQIWSRIGLKIFGVQTVLIDRNLGSYDSSRTLFVSLNQTSLVELMAGNAAIPTQPLLVINFEFALLPTIGWLIWSCRSVVLIRQWKQQAKHALDKAANTLHEKRNFWISIEGKRSRHGELGEYRKGPVIMAIKSKADIVPVVFRGTEAVSPTGVLLVRPGTIEIELCEKIDTRRTSLEQRDLLVARMRALAEQKLKLSGND